MTAKDKKEKEMASIFEGIKVVDVSQVAAMPLAARMLADFGADVIHVERPLVGDTNRVYQAGVGGKFFPQALWIEITGGKNSTLGTGLPQDADQSTGIDPLKSDDFVLLEVLIEAALRTPVTGPAAILLYDKSL